MKASNQETLIIRGMDELTEKQEVSDALIKAAPNMIENGFRLSDLRPMSRNRRAATLIGGQGRLEKRVEVLRCGKCWAYDHTAKDCKGTDRRGHCFKCGRQGHLAKDCKEEAGCPLCEKPGHRAGSGECELFRRALSVRRRESRADTKSLSIIPENRERESPGEDIDIGKGSNKTLDPGEPDSGNNKDSYILENNPESGNPIQEQTVIQTSQET
ncbi:hypothetical protein ABEB36_011527 [Hypothenemus hampei]|uniref:CCHC-type domain-containing protein n=1 Tax=Hypothenemus hampei TaxID=57062 RepID=A0ABD1EGE1_HYPHA